MSILAIYVRQVLYLLVRVLIHGIRDVVWWINGTSQRVHRNSSKQHYGECAHVLSVIGRHRYDVSAQSSTLLDFIVLHEAFVHPDYILRDEVSLYHIDRHEAVFVECDPGVDVWDLSAYSFSRQGQHQEAVRVIVLPMYGAIQLAAAVGKQQNKLIFLGNISRCGSTLMCHLFQSTGKVIAYSEPGAINDLIDLEQGADNQSQTIATTAVTLLCKPSTHRPQAQAHVVKVMSGMTGSLALLYKCFPEACYLFMYRDHMISMMSLARLLPTFPYAYLQIKLRNISPALSRSHAIYEKFQSAKWNWQMVVPNAQAISVVLQATIMYYEVRRSGANIRCFRYEDVIARPAQTLHALFSYCALPTELVQSALGCLHVDSQENSQMSKRRAEKLPRPVFVKQDYDFIKTQCQIYSIPNVLECNDLEGLLF